MSRNKQMAVESRIIYTHTYTHMYMCICVLSCFSCPTLCELRESSLPGSSVYGIFQARILECVAMPSSGDLPNLGIKLSSPALQADSLLLSHQRSPIYMYMYIFIYMYICIYMYMYVL